MILNLNVLDSDNTLVKCELNVEELNNEVLLSLIMKDEIYQEKDTFPFVALCNLRLILEKQKRKICCKGNRLDVYSSGSTLVGFNAYMLKIGKPANDNDIICLFDEEIEFDKLSSVNEQEEYFYKWIESL